MKKSFCSVLFLTACLFALSGCYFRTADELYSLPTPSDIYVNLQSKINEVKGTAEYVAPQLGSNTQTIQLVDLNNDSHQEAIAFFRDPTAEKPLKICIFHQGESGEYELFAKIEGAATEIESIDYRDLSGSTDFEIIVSWKVGVGIHTLVAYSVSANQVDEVMRSGYTAYLSADLNQDKKDEILLVQMDLTNPSRNRVEFYANADAVMELRGSAPLSTGVTEPIVVQKGFLRDQTPALFVTSGFGENGRITDLFHVSHDALVNLSLNPETGQSTDTIRYFTSVEPCDIDKDGITEIPLTQTIPTPTSTPESFWQIRWMQYDANGIPTLRQTTYHNNSDRWYLVLPEPWTNLVTLSRQENSAMGERAVSFSYWDGVNPPAPFLTIYRLTGSTRSTRAQLDARFILWSDSETIYAAEFLHSTWDCGLNEETLTTRFHLIDSGWSGK